MEKPRRRKTANQKFLRPSDGTEPSTAPTARKFHERAQVFLQTKLDTVPRSEIHRRKSATTKIRPVLERPRLNPTVRFQPLQNTKITHFSKIASFRKSRHSLI
jgi:hypothetical protein